MCLVNVSCECGCVSWAKLQDKFEALQANTGFHCGFDNAVYMSERDTGYTNYALVMSPAEGCSTLPELRYLPTPESVMQ